MRRRMRRQWSPVALLVEMQLGHHQAVGAAAWEESAADSGEVVKTACVARMPRVVAWEGVSMVNEAAVAQAAVMTQVAAAREKVVA